MPHERLWPPQNFATVQGHRVHYVVRGNGPALVLVHGFPGYSFSWRRNLDALGESFRVYAPDMMGLGYSDRPGDYSYSLPAAAGFICEFAGAVGESQIFLAGHSWGGAAALLCAAQHPALVRKLLLLAPVNPFDRRLRLRLRLNRIPLLPDLILCLGRLNTRRLAAFLLRYRLYANRGHVTGDTIEGYAQPLEGAQTVHVVRSTLRAMEPECVRSALGSVRQPVMLIWGDRDRVVRLDSAQPLVDALHAELKVIAGCGHLPAEEAPAVVNPMFVKFFLDIRR